MSALPMTEQEELSDESSSPASSDGTTDSEEEWVDERSQKQRIVDCVLLNLTNIAWAADNAVLPAMFKELSKYFGVTSSHLSFLVMLRGVTESLFAFPSGFLAEVLPRPALIAFGVLLWAAGMFGCALVETFSMLCVCRVVNGMGLGIVQPLLNSLVADTNPKSRRGIAFGTMQFSGNMGATTTALIATQLAPLMIASIAGWRLSLMMVSAFSAFVGILVMLFVGEPKANTKKRRTVSLQSLATAFSENLPKVGQIFRVKTFLIVIAQGSPGMVPWYAFAFLTMWLELSCFSNRQAARIYSCFGLGQALAGLFGGNLLDMVARRHPDHGPPSLAMLSVGIGMPLLCFIIYGLGTGEGAGTGTMVQFCFTFLVFGMFISWCGIINKKVFADIVPQAVFTYVYAFDRVVEGTLGAAGSPAVGLLTDSVFHFNATIAQLGDCAPEDARSLGNGILSVSLTAWALCFCLFGVMHCTYPADRRRMLEEHVLGKGSPFGAGEVSDDGEDNGKVEVTEQSARH